MLPVGLNMAIVTTLKSYKRELPIDFLARTLGRQSYEIRPNLQNLERMGVVRIVGDNVALV